MKLLSGGFCLHNALYVGRLFCRHYALIYKEKECRCRQVLVERWFPPMVAPPTNKMHSVELMSGI